MSNIYTYQELAKQLRVDYWRAYRLAQQNPEIGFTVGKKRLFTEDDVMALQKRATCAHSWGEPGTREGESIFVCGDCGLMIRKAEPGEVVWQN